jgi:hypothetical protein
MSIGLPLSDDEKRRRFEKALAYAGNSHSVNDVVGMIKDGRAQFFSNGDGNIVTELHRYPNFSAVHFWLISGELRSCLALEHEILPWAIENGCSIATATGRRGWGRVAAPTGWRMWMPTYVKTLVRSS